MKGGTRLTCVVEGVEHRRLPEVKLPEGHGDKVGALGLAGSQQALPRSLLGAADRAALGALAAHVYCPQSPPRPAPALASDPGALGRSIGLQRPRRPRGALAPRRLRAGWGLGRRPEGPRRGGGGGPPPGGTGPGVPPQGLPLVSQGRGLGAGLGAAVIGLCELKPHPSHLVLKFVPHEGSFGGGSRDCVWIRD